MAKFKLTKEMEHFIQLQRTNIKDNVGERYYRNILMDYKLIQGHIGNPKRILDIGCGIAGIDFFIALMNPGADIILRDKTETSKEVFYGFKERTAFYNSLTLARDFLRKHMIDNPIILNEAIDDHFDFKEVDLVISLISWGFHYPTGLYFDSVKSCLSEKGRVIMDVRKSHIHETTTLFKESGFKGAVLHEATTYRRFCFFK